MININHTYKKSNHEIKNKTIKALASCGIRYDSLPRICRWIFSDIPQLIINVLARSLSPPTDLGVRQVECTSTKPVQRTVCIQILNIFVTYWRIFTHCLFDLFFFLFWFFVIFRGLILLPLKVVWFYSFLIKRRIFSFHSFIHSFIWDNNLHSYSRTKITQKLSQWSNQTKMKELIYWIIYAYRVKDYGIKMFW